MKHLSGYDNIFETEACHFWNDGKVFLGQLNWRLGTKGQHSDPANKTLLGLVLSAMFLHDQNFC